MVQLAVVVLACRRTKIEERPTQELGLDLAGAGTGRLAISLHWWSENKTLLAVKITLALIWQTNNYHEFLVHIKVWLDMQSNLLVWDAHVGLLVGTVWFTSGTTWKEINITSTSLQYYSICNRKLPYKVAKKSNFFFFLIKNFIVGLTQFRIYGNLTKQCVRQMFLFKKGIRVLGCCGCC